VPFVRTLMKKHQVPDGTLCFETPDSTLVANGEAMRPVVAGLRSLGCRLAIGSVGRQTVSFKRIHGMGAAYVKIDGALVRELDRDGVSFAKVGALHRVCRSAGMETVAEFVEEPQTIARLKELGVDYAQGFGISKPAPLSQLEPGKKGKA
jgi:EAL domain-containing protein (putative c-di-GMP-specific phosphodiesterase class I)